MQSSSAMHPIPAKSIWHSSAGCGASPHVVLKDIPLDLRFNRLISIILQINVLRCTRFHLCQRSINLQLNRFTAGLLHLLRPWSRVSQKQGSRLRCPSGLNLRHVWLMEPSAPMSRSAANLWLPSGPSTSTATCIHRESKLP